MTSKALILLPLAALASAQSPFAPHHMSPVGQMGIKLIVLVVHGVGIGGACWCLYSMSTHRDRSNIWRIVGAVISVIVFFFASDLVDSWFS